MTDVLPEVDAPSDAELISRVRGGNVAAYGDLFARHKDAAQRLARQLVRGTDADDLVSEAFAKVLSVLQGGGGPDVAFRAYLLTAVRRLHVDRVRSGQRLQTTDDMTPFDPGVPFQDTAVAGFESGAAAKAFASLPERWQLVLWHLEVEGQKPADIAPLLGMSANSVSALAYRAREGLRQAFLTMHLSDLSETDCRWVTEHLGAYVRKGLAKRDAAKVQQHLDGCRRCTAMYLELTEVNSNLAGIIAPLLLGAAATGYLASSGAGAAGVLGLLARSKEFIGANTGAVAAGGVGAAVVAAAVAAIAIGGGNGHKPDVVADPPAAATTTAGAPSPSLGTPGTGEASTKASGPTTGGASAPASPGATVAALVPAGSTTALETPIGGVNTAAPGDGSTDAPGSGSTGPSAGPSGGPPEPGGPTLDLAGTTIDDNGVNLQAAGHPLPDVLTVDLLSHPVGVVFDAAGVQDAGCTAVSDTRAQCLTGSGAAGARIPGTALVATATTFHRTLPFDQTQGGNADVSVSVNGEATGFGSHRFTRDVDVALTLPDRSRPDGESYPVTGSLSITGPRRAAVRQVVYTISGGVFGNQESSVARAADDVTPTFVVVPADHVAPDVHIAAAPQPALHDTDSTNDAPHADLAPYDVRVDSIAADQPTASRAKAQTFTATLHDDGFPGSVELQAMAPAGDTVTAPERVGDSVTFTVTGKEPGPVNLTTSLPTGYTDANDSNNHAATPAAFTPHDFGVDVALTGFPTDVVHPGLDDRYSVSGHLSVTGPAAAELDTVTYTVTGGVFTSPFATDGGTSLTKPATDTAPSFEIVPDDLASPDVGLTATVTGDFTDTDPTNDTAALDLARYDVRVDSIAADQATAGRAKTQSFTASVDDDGFPESLDLQVSKPEGDTVTGLQRVGDTVTFTVTGKEPGPVNLTTSLPTGYTDADDSNNHAATPAAFTPHDFGVDVGLTGFPTDVLHPDADDVYPVSGQLTVTGPAAAELDKVSYLATGARFVGADQGSDGRTLTVPATLHDLSFHLVPDDAAKPGAVTVEVDQTGLGEFVDTDPTNGTATLRLARHDVRVDSVSAKTSSADRDNKQSFTATVHDDGFPGILDLQVSKPDGDTVSGLQRIGDTVTFTVTGTKSGAVNLRATLPEHYTDADVTNNHAPRDAAFTPHDFSVDVALTGFPKAVVHPVEDDEYKISGQVAVTGPAAADLDTITYKLIGGTFSDVFATDGGTSLTRPATDAAPSFQIVPDDPAAPGDVRLTATVSSDFTDTNPGNDTAPLTLSRYNVKVTSIAAVGGVDSTGAQPFTATIDDDGFGSGLLLEATAPKGDEASHPTRIGNLVTFTVRGSVPGQVDLTASLPARWYDANHSDNTLATRFVPTTDMRVHLVPNVVGNSGKALPTAQVTNPAGQGGSLVISFNPDDVDVTGPPLQAPCDQVGGRITCAFQGDSSPVWSFSFALSNRPHARDRATITFEAVPPAGSVESTPADNIDSLTLVRD